MPATISMTDTQFDKLRKIIYDRSGIHFQDSKKYVLESRLSRRIEELEFDTFDQYLMFLTAGPYQTDRGDRGDAERQAQQEDAKPRDAAAQFAPGDAGGHGQRHWAAHAALAARASSSRMMRAISAQSSRVKVSGRRMSSRPASTRSVRGRRGGSA